MTPQRLTMLVFFLQPLAFGAWLPRIPEMQQRLGLGPQDLAFALLGLPIGILLTLPFAGPLVGRIGGRAAIGYGFPAFFVAVCLPGFAGNSFWLFGGLLLSGVAMSTLELGLNITADEVEKGRVQVNGQAAKPARSVRVNDLIQIRQPGSVRELLVLGLDAMRGPATVARTLYRETEASIQAQQQASEARKFGVEPANAQELGRPTKRDRRDLVDWQRWSASVDDQ